jgi:hypothetical protein
MVIFALHRRDLLAGAAALAAAGGVQAQTSARKILRVVPQADPPILDPVWNLFFMAVPGSIMIAG